MKIILDGDLYCYQYAFTNEDWMEVDGWLLPHFDLRVMQNQFSHFIAENIPKCESLVIALSDSLNFRKTLGLDYKKNRSGPKPIMYKRLVDWVRKEFDTLTLPTLEADDVLGIKGTSEGYVLISEDKDLKTIPGHHYDLKEKQFFTVSPTEADRFWMTQTLTGDSTDGYPGCPGIGPVKADKLLSGAASLREMWPRVVEAYVAAGLTENDAIGQARLARILRHGDYDFNTRSVKLWKP